MSNMIAGALSGSGLAVCFCVGVALMCHIPLLQCLGVAMVVAPLGFIGSYLVLTSAEKKDKS